MALLEGGEKKSLLIHKSTSLKDRAFSGVTATEARKEKLLRVS